jgi:hypothetical protein
LSTSKSNHPLSQNHKFKKAVILTSELASLASEASKIHFVRRMKLLKELVEHWKENEEVALVEIDKGKLTCLYVSDISRIKDKAGRYLYVCTWLRDR